MWFEGRSPNFPKETFLAIVQIAKNIQHDSRLEKLFYLMLYARDFGWADTGQGQFHQTTGLPIIKQILTELELDPRDLQTTLEWQANHSLPAEMFLGEPSLKTVYELLESWKEADPNFYAMLAMLSVLELSSLTAERSAVYGDNTAMLVMIANTNKHPDLYQRLVSERIVHLAASKMRLSTTPEEEQQQIREKSAQRGAEIEAFFKLQSDETLSKIERFIKEVDLHYVAATFPQMTPAAIARFIKISALFCCPTLDSEMKHTHVINMRQDAAGANALEVSLTSEMTDDEIAKKMMSVNPDNQWLVWTPLLT